ncbi:nucleotide pyrophosphohydrolase [Ornithinibacillus halophilus]|uniref:nucleotide pyrophosphohydrolase n=1 Tax=Ornithinibacillus halophilus TaxID=930117 RepID=UPI0038994D29
MKKEINDGSEVFQITQVYTTKDIQKLVDDYIAQFKEGYFTPLSLTARLTEEVGELAREINHYYGEKPKKATEEEKTVEEEVGDIIFVLACFANSLDFDLSESFHMAMNKFETRDKNRWTKKE